MKNGRRSKQRIADECWAIIFKNLNHESDQESISLVCKRFLSITNSVKVSIKVLSPSIKVFSGLLQRFLDIKKIQLSCFPGDLNKVVHAVAQSRLDLEELDMSFNGSLQRVCFVVLGSKMQNLKVLKCSYSLEDADLVRITNSFPQLEELQIGNPYFNKGIMTVSDQGIDYFSSKLKSLRKIDLLHNLYISDKSLVSLSSNCAFLEHMTVSYCHNVTENGISFLTNNSHHLKFLHLHSIQKIESFKVKGSADFLQNLQTLKLIHVGMSDELLYSITEAQIPLTEISLSFCEGCTFTGILRLLRSYQSLKTLVLKEAKFLTNKHIEYLSSFLHNLNVIKLHNCPQLSDSAFVTLTQICPLLCHLEMRCTSLGIEDFNYDGLMENFAMKYLILSSNSYLSTSCLKRLLNICPNVEKIDMSYCFLGDEELDVADILECNKGIVKSLVLDGCSHLKVSKTHKKISNLEMLVAKISGINNEMLDMIGKMCPGLIHLDLGYCRDLTEEGVKEVVKSCKRLRFLGLSECTNLDISIIAWTVSNSKSLRKLVSPSHTYPDDENHKHFLLLGCHVTRGTVTMAQIIHPSP